MISECRRFAECSAGVPPADFDSRLCRCTSLRAGGDAFGNRDWAGGSSKGLADSNGEPSKRLADSNNEFSQVKSEDWPFEMAQRTGHTESQRLARPPDAEFGVAEDAMD